MRIENRFTVSLPVDDAWKVLLDVEGIAPCMPGAEIDDVIEDGFAGRVKIKLGAIVTQFKGTVRFTEMDEEAHRIVLHASGRETRGQGNATADVTVVLSPTGTGTEVAIDADLTITGKIIQYGRGVIVDVSAKLIGQFVDCLDDKLAAEGLSRGSWSTARPPEVVGVILGAGASRRLGRPKQTLPFGDTTLLGWTLRNVEASTLDRVVLVLGGAADDVLAGLTPSRAKVVRNDDYGTGCTSSLLAGLDSAGPCDAVMLLLGDMPGVGPAVIDEVLAAWARDRPWGAVTSYRGTPGHPFVFGADAFPSLRRLHGDKAVWKLLDARPDRVRMIPVNRDVPLDVDTWDDYEATVTSLIGLRDPPGSRPTE